MLQPMYEHALATANGRQVLILEAKLAWIVRVCAAMVGGHYTLETQIKIEGSRVQPTAVMGTNMQVCVSVSVSVSVSCVCVCVCVYIHTYIGTYIGTYIHTHIHTYIQT